jgi:chemotaxis protein CheD
MSGAALASPNVDIMVRMGALAVSAAPGVVLATIGLGSCVGVALVDADAGVVGLAHVMLPQARPEDAATPGKFADLAIPALIAEMTRLGAVQRRLEATLVGGARMFATRGASRLDIGERNVTGTTEALAQVRVPVRAQVTAGSVGRTVWVSNDGPSVLVREARNEVREVYRARRGRLASRRIAA